MVAESRISTANGSKYLKWVCGHFKLKVPTEFDDNEGKVEFPFGHCEMYANNEELYLWIKAENAEDFERLKFVVGDHLERFAKKENIQVAWMDAVEE